MKTERHDRREQHTDTNAGVDPKEGGAVMLRTTRFSNTTGLSAYTRIGHHLASTPRRRSGEPPEQTASRPKSPSAKNR